MPDKKPSAHPHDGKSPASRPTVRSATIRKGGRDGSFTPTEIRKKNQLMRQFQSHGRKGGEMFSGNSKAYRDNYDACFAKDDEEAK